MWNEAQIEELLDRRVQSRLATDRDYLFAENAEQQALAERKIELQEERALLTARGKSYPTGRTVGEANRDEDRISEIDAELERICAELREA